MLNNPRNILLQIGNFGVKELKKMTPKATGRTRRKIKSKVFKSAKGWQLEFITPDWWGFAAVTGRGPGPMPPIDNLKIWAEAIGLDVSPFAIGVSIRRDGTILFQKGGNQLGLDLIMSNVEKMTVEKLEPFYKKLVEDSIEKELEEL